MIRRVGWLVGGLTLAGTGGYTLVYLYRWEWNRALFTGLLFIAIEVGVVGLLMMRRVARIEQRVEHPTNAMSTLGRIQAAGPERDHFAWLESSVSQLNVFVTVLLGAGVLLSGATWLVDRVASRSTVPTLERDLAGRLEAAAFPTEPLVPGDAELLAQGGPYGEDHVGILLGPWR